MYNIPGDLLDGYRSGPEIFEALLEGCTQEEAQAAKGGDEGWSVVEVMCHMRDAEERAYERMRLMRDEPSPFLPGYDQDAWAIERNYAAADLRQVLAEFISFRKQHVADLEALAPGDWGRPGWHEEMGEVNISGQTLHMVAHDAQHAAQIARQLRSVRTS
jgi:hypothetical protein